MRRKRWPRRRAPCRLGPALLCGALLALASACPRPSAGFGPTPFEAASEVLEAMAKTQAAPDHVVGEAKVHLVLPGGTSGGADHFVAAMRPDSLRLDTLGFFGTPLGMILVHRGTLTVWHVQAGQAFRGPATAESLGLVAAIDLGPADAVAALLGTPRLLEGRRHLDLDQEARRYVVTIEGAAGLRQELRISPEDHLLREVVWWKDGEARGRLSYARYRRGGRAFFPYELRYEDASGARLELEWREVHVDGADFDPSLFEVELPDAVEVRPLDPAQALPPLPAADEGAPPG
ncbi:MAG: DUF4292 domain-containing protein [Deltaproteobacteria bacterium]|nr:MAG: DUF4292 domain-containing protein [Deltaproteobacteria bacterium]